MTNPSGQSSRESIPGALKRGLQALGFRKTLPVYLPLGVFIGICLNLTLTGWFSVLPIPDAWLGEYADSSEELRTAGLLKALYTALLSPCLEEIIFRGCLCGILKKITPGWFALLCSTALFAVMHQTPFWIAFAFIGGLALGAVFLLSDSLYPCILTHIAFNSLSYLLKVINLPETRGGVLAMSIITLLLLISAFAIFAVIRKKSGEKKPANQRS